MKDVNQFRQKMKVSMWLFILIYVFLIFYMGYSVVKNGASWYATPYNKRIINARSNIKGGTIYDRNGVKLAWSKGTTREYNTTKGIRRSTSHIIGDIYGKTIGAETTFAKHIYGLDTGIFTLISKVFSGNIDSEKGDDITLTIDANLSEYIYNKMDGKRGAVVVMNYKTGEILSCVSILTFDPKTVNKDKLEDTALVNRATMGKYPPGSIMKIVTASAAIENNIDFEYTCTGSEMVDGQMVTCTKAHGTQTLSEAFTHSCNTYFAMLSVKLGEKKLMSQANKFKFNYEFNNSDIIIYQSNFELSNNKGDLAWAGIGQYNDLVTPIHACMITCAVANNGNMVEPRLLKSVNSTDVVKLDFLKNTKIMSGSTALKLKEMMKNVVESGTGTSAKIKGVNVYGKTGTAEYNDNGEIKNHSWFVGFLDEEHPYACAAVFEGAGYGSSVAAPIVKKVFEYIISKGI